METRSLWWKLETLYLTTYSTKLLKIKTHWLVFIAHLLHCRNWQFPFAIWQYVLKKYTAGMVVCPTCSLSKQVMSLVTTSTTALRGAATSLELAERRRGSTLSTRFLLCTARRSVDRLQTKVRAQSDGLAARNHSRWVHFRKISSADAEKRRGKTKKYHR